MTDLIAIILINLEDSIYLLMSDTEGGVLAYKTISDAREACAWDDKIPEQREFVQQMKPSISMIPMDMDWVYTNVLDRENGYILGKDAFNGRKMYFADTLPSARAIWETGIKVI